VRPAIGILVLALGGAADMGCAKKGVAPMPPPMPDPTYDAPPPMPPPQDEPPLPDGSHSGHPPMTPPEEPPPETAPMPVPDSG
jgi:hypothetical protein